MSYAKQILTEIAQEMGKPQSMVEQHIKTLEDNWYDTQEALQSLDDQTFDSLNLPKRLQVLIKQKINGNSVNQQQVQQQQQQFQQQPQQQLIQPQYHQQQQPQQKMQIEEENKQQVKPNIPQESQEEKVVYNLNKEVNDNEKFISCCQLLYKILFNINENPLEPKYRTLKKSNQKIHDTALQYPSAVQVLSLCGFSQDADNYTLEQSNIDQLYMSKIMKKLQEKAEAVASLRSFNPYQSTQSFAGNRNQQGGSLMQKAGVTSFYDQLIQLKLHRQKIMSIPVKDRRINCVLKQNIVQSEIEATQDPEYKKTIKDAIIKMAEEEVSFSSKRKQEYDDLIKQPCYQETLVRVKFANDINLEIVMSPLETIRDLVNIVQQNLADPNLPFYLYDTPPLRKFKGQDLEKTFDELEACPGVNLYFGLQDDSILQTQKYFLKENLINKALQQ